MKGKILLFSILVGSLAYAGDYKIQDGKVIQELTNKEVADRIAALRQAAQECFAKRDFHVSIANQENEKGIALQAEADTLTAVEATK